MEILFPIVFLLILGIFAYVLVGNIAQWNHNNHSPRLTVDATVVTKRIHISHSYVDKMNNIPHTSTSYYATFQVASGDRMELMVPHSEYGYLVEGDTGKLTFQGTRFLGFERS